MDDGGTSWHKLAPVVWKLKRQAADLKGTALALSDLLVVKESCHYLDPLDLSQFQRCQEGKRGKRINVSYLIGSFHYYQPASL
jgi:hypothetical protein